MKKRIYKLVAIHESDGFSQHSHWIGNLYVRDEVHKSRSGEKGYLGGRFIPVDGNGTRIVGAHTPYFYAAKFKKVK